MGAELRCRSSVSAGPFRLRLGGPQLEADLTLDDFAQCGILGRKFLERFDQRATAAPELFHAARDHIDQYIRVVDYLECSLEVIVSHGWKADETVD